MPLRIVYDPIEAFDRLDALYDTDPVLYDRVYDLLERIQDDPHRPETAGRVHSLRDKDDMPLLGTSVRSPHGEVAVVWGQRSDDEGDVVKVAYIGDNSVLRL